MFTKEEIVLAKPVYEAIPKIAESQEKECPRCEGTGHRIRKILSESSTPKPTKCDKCSGSGKLRGKWEWEPEIRDQFYTVDYPEKVLYVAHFGTYWLGNPAIEDEERQPHCIKDCIPLLHWENNIEKILGRTGYKLIGLDRGESKQFHCDIMQNNNLVVATIGKTRQLAVMRAVIELANGKLNPRGK